MRDMHGLFLCLEVAAMDDGRIQRMTAAAAGKRFGSHDVLYGRYIPQFPVQAEREYLRLAGQYMRILKEELENGLPALKEVYGQEQETDAHVSGSRQDGFAGLLVRAAEIFRGIKERILEKTEGFGLRRRLGNIARMNRKLTVKEWKKTVKSTIGINIMEDYYLGDFYMESMEAWVEENVRLIKTVPEDTLDRMKEIVCDGFMKGKPPGRMAEEIRKAYGMGKRHAELIARDQTGKLNGQIQKAQQTDAGITEYVWYTCMDGRVRRSHKELHGKKFRWDDPPENSDGRKCHPGQDFQCRCIGRPVFNRRTISLPVDYGGGSG